jgi:hypothetical protein
MICEGKLDEEKRHRAAVVLLLRPANHGKSQSPDKSEPSDRSMRFLCIELVPQRNRLQIV